MLVLKIVWTSKDKFWFGYLICSKPLCSECQGLCIRWNCWNLQARHSQLTARCPSTPTSVGRPSSILLRREFAFLSPAGSGEPQIGRPCKWKKTYRWSGRPPNPSKWWRKWCPSRLQELSIWFQLLWPWSFFCCCGQRTQRFPLGHGSKTKTRTSRSTKWLAYSWSLAQLSALSLDWWHHQGRWTSFWSCQHTGHLQSDPRNSRHQPLGSIFDLQL